MSAARELLIPATEAARTEAAYAKQNNSKVDKIPEKETVS
ncbi:hypothetical protein UNSWDHB_2764 [Dehalobacter sp. UNSWDHB]|nr:hypothetical protein DHBDCA_p2886 [Dehalobacter sp. DCA]AFV06892.1 hypothetical protein DCF50_p2889 [Dehalobacter sp. CF]EQB19930.1 hypothetical protein UNSWDHB_2764 [Dehalobacter sp. UNSWDHB]